MKRTTITTIPIACLAVLLSCGGEPTPPVTPAEQPEIPISGAAVPGMGSYDQTIPDLMRKYAIPGGAVAVLRDGKLIYARGFGYADVENKTPVQPDALFRIASVSKPITGVAIMKLVEEGKLELMDSHGGRVSSTVDLLRFMAGVDDGANRPDILSAALLAELTSNGSAVCAGGACY